jgi:hypothetical protein
MLNGRRFPLPSVVAAFVAAAAVLPHSPGSCVELVSQPVARGSRLRAELRRTAVALAKAVQPCAGGPERTALHQLYCA